ncbi:MAG: peptidase [Lachnospiraceae bacterium]|uniref:prepilin peptidase n=1 Tax=unclassified Agathobacter TaxID=2641574 RepID=UPI002A635F2B|nr:prepilin peptidase [Agathobacter sp.]MDD6353634.1 peptidase [Lachnospiraceae bacterium]MDD7206296.1 peptidase [Lachnospiraceae bacterium]MDY5861939.1 peptidase [Agathobacter sp.]
MIQLIIFLGIISIIDISTKKIPVILLIIMGIAGGVYIISCDKSVINTVISIIPGGILLMMAFFTKEQIGYGDAVVVTLMGLFVSVDIVCSSLVMGLTIAGIVSVVYIVIKRADRKKQIAFTPFLLLGYGLTGVFL